MSATPREGTDVLKAIETSYKGYRFRSRLEARWAVFFDSLNIKWEYEKEGYDLGSIGFYLPDFWFPKIQMWAEIKGSVPTPDEILKAEYLGINSGISVVIISGTPMEEDLMIFDPIEKNWLRPDFLKDLCIWCHLAGIKEAHGILPNFCEPIRNAYTAARSARFEHGEKPSGDPVVVKVIRKRTKVVL